MNTRAAIRIAACLVGGLSLSASIHALHAQSSTDQLDTRVKAVKSGRVRMSFAARDGVCGDGNNWYRTRPGSATGFIGNRDVEGVCERGPVRVVVVRDGGVTTDVRTYVGGRWKSDSLATDLGTINARTAGEWLLSQAQQSDPQPARGAMSAAMIADSVDASATLLQIAKNERVQQDVRGQALLWLAEAVGEKVTSSLDSIAYEPGDRELRRQAIFAVSRRPVDEAVPSLIRMAETLKDRELRRTAVFLLGRSKDPRALGYFERVLSPR